MGVVAVVLLGTPTPAQAAPCNRPDLLEAIPPDGAKAVPINATLFARYTPSAEYLGEEVVLEHVGVGEAIVQATFDATEGMLKVTPEPALTAGDEYVVRWPRLRGFSSANLGRGADVRFTVGTTTDVDPPEFIGVVDLDWTLEREKDECTDSLETRYLFDLKLAPASDDGGTESLTLLLFQTRGEGVSSAAPKPIAIRRFPTSREARVRRSVAQGAGEVCYAAIARDLTGQVSASGNREVCVETAEPPFFEGCRVAATGVRARGAGWLALLVMMMLGVRRRSGG